MTDLHFMAFAKKDKSHNCWGIYKTSCKIKNLHVLGKKAGQIIGKISLSNDFIEYHIS